jgi:hypothetical protein
MVRVGGKFKEEGSKRKVQRGRIQIVGTRMKMGVDWMIPA